ncbi:endo alpha-1,4 polygalactosaminidase [Streptomyces sp. W16]|uniref:endo alpha-1,4 polygalactosaminidase n=1 Tax=Streptomyces sp. W16 TaxID=3076631 RepID=UPI00295B3B36|nr:endo alpha-1,4 polygalactosaminidase [Streptomyces sp. W16]MDV9176405.1 endo alpha-1,4 polygalactosaminidase [Streptomyces sp. W16]
MRRPAALFTLLLLLAGCTSAPDDKPESGKRWQPRPGVAWQWQLSGRLDTSVDVPVYDIDGFDRSKATVTALHDKGRKVICYISTGAWEDFRPDAKKFPKPVLGKGNGWKGERWLDIRRTDVLEPLMATRLDMCRAKGFDAVEPDNMDGYQNDTGFPLKPADQLRYNRLVAELAHDRGMSVGLKNDLAQIPALASDFDFAVNEQCAQYGECDTLKPFIKANKAVFHVEYELPTSRFCPDSRRLKLSSLLKKPELGAWRKSC